MRYTMMVALMGLAMGQTPTPSPTSHDDGHDHDHDDHDHEEGDNYELAFGLVSAAGMAMAFGAAGIFAPGMQTASKSKAWGAALALSAGMLIFLSLMEFAEESIIEFEVYVCVCVCRTL